MSSELASELDFYPYVPFPEELGQYPNTLLEMFLKMVLANRLVENIKVIGIKNKEKLSRSARSCQGWHIVKN